MIPLKLALSSLGDHLVFVFRLVIKGKVMLIQRFAATGYKSTPWDH